MQSMISGLIAMLHEGEVAAVRPPMPSNFPTSSVEALSDEEEDKIEAGLESVRKEQEGNADEIQARWAMQRERFANPGVF